MAEYSRVWNDGLVREFKQYDLNNDGYITPAESVSGSRGAERISSSRDSSY
jgi:hypothetical protein